MKALGLLAMFLLAACNKKSSPSLKSGQAPALTSESNGQQEKPPFAAPADVAQTCDKLRKMGFQFSDEQANNNKPIEWAVLYKSPFTGEASQTLAGLPALRQLTFYGAPIEDGTLANLKNIPTLRRITIQTNDVSENELKQLARVIQLESIAIEYPLVTDAVVQEWRTLVNLSQLRIDPSKLTPAGMASLQSLPKVQIADFYPQKK